MPAKPRRAPKRRQRVTPERRARAWWASIMFLPAFLLIEMRLMVLLGYIAVPDEGSMFRTWLQVPAGFHPDLVSVTPVSFAIGYVCCIALLVLTELFGRTAAPVYAITFLCAFSWGSFVDLTEDLILVRFVCMFVFGVSAGALRYYWNRREERIARNREIAMMRLAQRRLQKSLADSRTADAHHGSSVTDGGSSGGEERWTGQGSDEQLEAELDAPVPHPESDLSLKVTEAVFSLWQRVGLALLFTLGEVCGCLVCVPSAYRYISASWYGYALLVLFPIVIYKLSSWLSHLLTLVFGTRVNVSNASSLLVVYWIFTTVISLAIFAVCILFVVSNWVPYVWNLQKLVGPYSLVLEFVVIAARHHQSTNPYKDIAEQYSAHISETLQDQRQYFRRGH